MSKIREILTPMLIESQKQSEREWMMVRVVQAVGQIDINQRAGVMLRLLDGEVVV